MFPNAQMVGAELGDVRGSRLLPTDRAATLQSGSPGAGPDPPSLCYLLSQEPKATGVAPLFPSGYAFTHNAGPVWPSGQLFTHFDY
jgi:hypothetical protein